MQGITRPDVQQQTEDADTGQLEAHVTVGFMSEIQVREGTHVTAQVYLRHLVPILFKEVHAMGPKKDDTLMSLLQSRSATRVSS